MAALKTADPDWSAAGGETVDHLRRLIRTVTVNPPGNELEAARYLAEMFGEAGIEWQLFEPAPGRATLVSRLRGTGAARPVLLVAHMDVVGVEPEHWSVDPFGAEVSDGYVYGRGALDDKGMLAANLETMLLLKRHVVDAGGELARDVVFVANSDEEGTGELGMAWLLAHHPPLVDAEFAINEGGRTRVVGGVPLYVAVQTAEKVQHVVRAVARGPSGHAAIPLAGNAIVRLGRALAAGGAHVEPVYLTPTTARFFRELSRVWPERDVARAMTDLSSASVARVRRGSAALQRIPVLDAVLRAGVSATVVAGGIRDNVIPAEATAVFDVRTLPGQAVDEVIDRLRQAIGDPLVKLEIVSRGVDAPTSDFASPAFAAIEASVRDMDATVAVVPYLGTGATESSHLRRHGIQAYGVLPFPLTQEDEDRMHGHDERIPIASVEFGIRLLYGAVKRLAASS